MAAAYGKWSVLFYKSFIQMLTKMPRHPIRRGKVVEIVPRGDDCGGGKKIARLRIERRPSLRRVDFCRGFRQVFEERRARHR